MADRQKTDLRFDASCSLNRKIALLPVLHRPCARWAFRGKPAIGCETAGASHEGRRCRRNRSDRLGKPCPA
jgi:hypothetical protein